MASDVPDRPRGGIRNSLDGRPLLVDALIALGLTLLSLVTIAGGAGDFGSLSPLSLTLVLLQTVPLVARRIVPVPVFLVTFGALLGQGLFAGDSFSSSLGALVALFTVAEREPQRVSIAAAFAGAVGIAVLIIGRVGHRSGGDTSARSRSEPPSLNGSASSAPPSPSRRSGSGSHASCTTSSRTT